MNSIIPDISSGSSPPGGQRLSNGENLEDYHWLVSAAAQKWLQAAAEASDANLVRVTLALRKDLGTSRTHLVIAQAQLRHRATVKFQHADKMFFTRQLLEQATDDQIAGYKAGRFTDGIALADLCCGIGGDLMALASRGPALGIDRDPIATVLAAANCQAIGAHSVEFTVADVRGLGVNHHEAWHVDPDRRVEATGTGRRRTTQIELHDPDLETIQRLLSENRTAAVKLAPATDVSKGWAEEAELEWIGNRGECRQQIAWFEKLASHPGQRVATVFAASGATPRTIHGQPDRDIPVATQVGKYVFEPHAAVLAAELAGLLAHEHQVPCLSPGIPYLTGDSPITDPALACFEVVEILPVDPKYLRSAIRDRGIGNLEVKKRGVKIDPEEVRREIHPRGEGSATLIILPVKKKVAAILAHRVTAAEA
jgi:hypothetical protein